VVAEEAHTTRAPICLSLTRSGPSPMDDENGLRMVLVHEHRGGAEYVPPFLIVQAADTATTISSGFQSEGRERGFAWNSGVSSPFSTVRELAPAARA